MGKLINDEFTLDCLREKEVLWKIKFGCRSARVGNPPLLNLQTWKRPKITGSYQGGEDVQCGASLPCDSYKVWTPRATRGSNGVGFHGMASKCWNPRNDAYLAIPEIRGFPFLSYIFSVRLCEVAIILISHMNLHRKPFNDSTTANHSYMQFIPTRNSLNTNHLLSQWPFTSKVF